ncbi:MAG: helix-turn-helix transcriptional regulator [Oscillospiraceae bacterium]|nr:helix-turn-helix transcriptional regulator [Oscillospiraceae bacterium]
MTKYDSFGNRLRQFREANGLSLRDVAQKTGIPFQTLSRYENGTHSPKVDIVTKISDLYNIDCKWLCGFTPNDDYYYLLTENEKAIIDYYRSATDVEKEMVERMCKVT